MMFLSLSFVIEHYKNEGLHIEHDVEHNDGCAIQFKCIRVFSALARRNIKTTSIFCETSHGKSKSDGLGGVVNCYVSCSVCGEKTIIRNGKELFQFYEENLVVRDAFESNKPMLNRLFFFTYHQMILMNFVHHFLRMVISILMVRCRYIPGDNSYIFFRNTSCGCKNCLSGMYKSC